MLELIFGWIIGVWMAQQFALPSVQTAVRNWWTPLPTTPENEEVVAQVVAQDSDSSPIFTGEMPSV